MFRTVGDDQLRFEVNQIIQECNGDFGTKMTYGALKSKKIKADKERVGKMLKELDPVGHTQRTTQKIKRREYKVTIINLKFRFLHHFTYCTSMGTIS